MSYRDEANKGRKVIDISNRHLIALEEEIYVIAMHLDLFVRHCFPEWTNVFSIASKIMTDLSTNDPEFYDHLKTISKVRTKINPKVNESSRSIDHLPTYLHFPIQTGFRGRNYFLGE